MAKNGDQSLQSIIRRLTPVFVPDDVNEDDNVDGEFVMDEKVRFLVADGIDEELVISLCVRKEESAKKLCVKVGSTVVV